MSENNGVSVIETEVNGKVTFANEVIAIIAALAAAEVDGLAGMSGGAMSGITEMLGRKSITKGVKVDVSESVSVDITVIVKYGFKLQEVCAKLQEAIKVAIETMTGLPVAAVNVYVQGIEIEKEEPVAEIEG